MDFNSDINSETKKAFEKELAESIQKIEASIESLQDGWQEDIARQIHLQAHKLAGSSAALEYHRLSFAARDIEKLLAGATFLSDSDPVHALLSSLDERLTHLKRIVSDLQSPHAENRITQSGDLALQDSRAGQSIYLVEDDDFQAKELAAQIGHFGYKVEVFTHLDGLRTALETDLPAAILMDIVFPEGDVAGVDAINELHFDYPVPVIFMSVRDDAVARLNAIRAGGAAYFTKPINFSLLIDTLDALTVKSDPVPHRIMVVDDSMVQANITALHLKNAGMEVQIVNDPLKSLTVLTEFMPDLLIFDMYMPECTGMELAAIIRQMESYVSIPIVFLSSETDRDKQLEAVGFGGDDFLTKPIQPEHLVAAVRSRVVRHHQLRSMMIRDSLTGLLNHTTIRERLNTELLRAARQNTPLTYVMLDLDHFKQVNDNYGHSTGDRVLKSLSQMLTKRLRQSDIIGRYGGEEFAIILPNTSQDVAETIMDELRDGFSQLQHHSGTREFFVTFSCGIATFPSHEAVSSLCEAADNALYAAKREGRNRTVVAPVK